MKEKILTAPSFTNGHSWRVQQKSFASLFLSHPIIFVQQEIAAFEALLEKKRYLLKVPLLSDHIEKQTSSWRVIVTG